MIHIPALDGLTQARFPARSNTAIAKRSSFTDAATVSVWLGTRIRHVDMLQVPNPPSYSRCSKTKGRPRQCSGATT